MGAAIGSGAAAATAPPARSGTRINVALAGVRPANAAEANDAALAAILAGWTAGDLELYWPGSADPYPITRSLNPDLGSFRMLGDGPTASRIVMSGRPDPILMLGMGRRPQGVAYDPAAHAVPAAGKLDSAAAAGRAGYRTLGTTHLVQLTGHLASYPWETLTHLRIEWIHDSTDVGEPAAGTAVLGIDGVWELLDGPTWTLWFWTTDDGGAPALCSYQWAAPGSAGMHRTSMQLDLTATPPVKVWRDNVQLNVTGSWTPPGSGVARRLARNRARAFGVGVASGRWFFNYNDLIGPRGQDRVIFGAACYADVAYADDGTGTAQRRLDGQAISDSSRCWDTGRAELIGTVMFNDGDADLIDRRRTVMGHGPGAPDTTSSLFIVADEHQRDGLDTFIVRDLTLDSPGDAVAIGAALGCRFHGVTLDGGPPGCGIRVWPGGANYFHRARNCSFKGGVANLATSYSIFDVADCDIPVHGQNTFLLENSAVTIRDIASTGFGAPDRIVYAIGCPKVILDNVQVDMENSTYPAVAAIENLTAATMGPGVPTLAVRDFNLGAPRPGTPFLKVGVLTGQPDMPARVDVSGTRIDAGATALSALVEVNGPDWFGTVDVTDDLGSVPAIRYTPATGTSLVYKVGPRA